MEKGTCIHFRGIQHKRCGAEVPWRKITGGKNLGIAKRMPCIQNESTQATCGSYCDPTDEQIEESEWEWERVIENIRIAQPLISKFKSENKEGGSGKAECPICKGILHYSVAKLNNHCHGKCETEGCLNWME